MSDSSEKHRLDAALFRYGIVKRAIGAREDKTPLAHEVHKIASERHEIPGSQRTRVAAQTIYKWINLYSEGGFDALFPKTRCDAGKPRRMSAEIIEQLLSEKHTNPSISVKKAIANVCETLSLADSASMPPSTVHRLFESEGLMQPNTASVEDVRAFNCEHPNDLWMADVLHGPSVAVPGKGRRKSYLIAIIDDCTRLIPYAVFDLTENAAAFMEVLKQAVTRRSVPKKLYVDNGSAFISRQLSLACARLDIALIHARPYKPRGKGKIERFFRTCRSGFIAHLQNEDTASLEALNAKLRVWIENEYHYTQHRGLNLMAPLDKWASCVQHLRPFPVNTNIDDLFLFEAKRKVNNDRTIRLHNRIYEVEPHLIGQYVTVRYDPKMPKRPVKIVFDSKHSTAHLADLHANSKIKRQSPDSPIRFSKFSSKEQ